MTARPRRFRRDLSTVVLDGEMVVHDPATQQVHHLNATATMVAELLDGRTLTDRLVDRLMTRLPGTDRIVVAHEVARIIDEFDHATLLVSEEDE